MTVIPFSYNVLIVRLLPPTLAIVEDDTLTTLTLVLREERELVTDTKLNILTNVEMCLGRSLQIKVVPDAILQSKADIVESLLTACTH